MTQKFVAIIFTLFAVALPPAASQTSDSHDNPPSKLLTWDVVSIKPHKQLDNWLHYAVDFGRN